MSFDRLAIFVNFIGGHNVSYGIMPNFNAEQNIKGYSYCL